MMGIKRLTSTITAAAVIAVAWVGGVTSAAMNGQGAPPTRSRPESTRIGNSTAIVRGKYLVTGVGCNNCHTPEKMGANGPEPDMSLMLSGHHAGPLGPPPALPPNGAWNGYFATGTAWAGPWGISFTANLTPDQETGLGEWTEQQFVDTIRTGRHQGRGRELLPPMPWQSFRNLDDGDLKAIFAYLRSIPAIKNKVPAPTYAPAPK